MEIPSKTSNNLMKAVILAAGLGSRLDEITKNIPKTMIQINGQYIFKNIVNAIVNNNIKDIIFVVGYKSELLREVICKELEHYDLNIAFVMNPNYQSTNTMYSLWLCRQYLDCDFVYFHGDLIFSEKMLKNFIKSGLHNAILIDREFPLDWEDAMKVITHDDKLKYMSKSITVNEMDGTAIGIYKFDKLGSRKLFHVIDNLIKKGVVSSWVSEAINIVSKKVTIKIEYNHSYPWADVDNLIDLEMGRKILQRTER